MPKRPAPKDNRKAKKKKYIEAAGFVLSQKSRGILVSCSEVGGAQREALSLFNEYYEKLYGDSNPPPQAAAAAEGSTNIAKLLQAEVAELKNTKQQALLPVHTGLGDLVFIRLTDAADPRASVVELVQAVVADAAATKILKSRHCVRLIPVETICDANIPAIEAAAAPLVAPYFPQEGPPVPFGCVVEFRSTKHLDKMAVVNASIKGIAQPPHKVNLNNPKKSILVQVFKSMCCLAVVDDFRALARFNLRELCAVEEDKSKDKGKQEGAGGEEKRAEGADAGPQQDEDAGNDDKEEQEV